MNSTEFFNRELSWLEFNARVINEATRPDKPLLERLKFLTIATSNFDEFFMVRVAGLRNEMETNPNSHDIAGMTPKMQLTEISKRVHELVSIQYSTLNKHIIPALKEEGIEYVPPLKYTPEQKSYLETLFHNEIFPLLTPLRTDNADGFPHINSLRGHIAFLLHPLFDTAPSPLHIANSSDGTHLAIVQLPSGIKRVMYLPAQGKKKQFAILDDVLKMFGTLLFPGFNSEETLAFRITRGADFAVDEDREDDFIEAMEEVLLNRQSSTAIRLTCGTESPQILSRLCEQLHLDDSFVYKIEGLPDVSALSELLNIEGFSHLKDEPWKTFYPADLDPKIPLWDTIKKRDLLIHVPYESYDPVINFLSTAAEDNDVLAIKMTLYRTGGNSPIVKSLERAARAGKQVTVFVELKARFDEKQNISWANQLEKAGVIVVYGIANLKVHAKMLLIVRKEPEGIRRYVHLATGNFNPKTAKLYVDMGLFTANVEIAKDATVFFNMISGYSAVQTMKRLIMAPINLKSQLLTLIDREAQHSTPESPGLIMAKMNSLGHQDIIKALYKANKAGVNIMLNVRGICMLIPGVKHQSERIQVISIVDRFLEHTRIFYFQNGGSEEVYLSSADWMPRNLDRRVELMFPVVQKDLFKKIKENLTLLFSDNTQAHYLQRSGSWILRGPLEKEQPIRVQEELYIKTKKTAEAHAQKIPKEFVVRRKK